MLAICAKPEMIREGFAAVKSAVENGEIMESRIDESLARIAKLKSKISPQVLLDTDRLAELSTQIQKLNEHLN
jgi:hypothetical protein